MGSYLFCQGEGVFGFHSDSQDFLVAVDDGVGDRSKSGVANLQAYASNVPHTLRKKLYIVTDNSPKQQQNVSGESSSVTPSEISSYLQEPAMQRSLSDVKHLRAVNTAIVIHLLDDESVGEG